MTLELTRVYSSGLQEAGLRKEFLRHGGQARVPQMRRSRGR